MKVFIRKDKDGDCASVNYAVALNGFKQMGWEIVSFQDVQEIKDIERDNVFVSFVNETKFMCKHFGVPTLPELSYPEELRSFLGRKIWKSTLNTIYAQDSHNVFIKPLHENKLFTGKLITHSRDFIGIGYRKEDVEVWCSEPVNFVCEARCFVRYGKILDVRKYKGDWGEQLDSAVIKKAVAAFHSAPNAYAIDFGLTDKGETLLIEVNDGYSLGCYGLFPISYAKLLSARWSQIMGVVDYCDF